MNHRTVPFLAALMAVMAVACTDPAVTVVTKEYAISFESNGGSAVGSLVVEEGAVINAPSAPAKDGYAFEGWYVDEALSDAWDFAADAVTGDLTLYAKWARVRSITYELNGGVNGGDNPASYVEGRAIALASPTRFCRDFDGWYESGDFSGDAVTEIPASATGEKALYAKWTWAEYAVRDRGPSGGWIVSVRDDAVAGDPMELDSWKYLEVRSADLPSLLLWPDASSGCADLSDAFQGVVYDDWRLPSRAELGLMRDELYVFDGDGNIGGFVTVNNTDSSYYWSSETAPSWQAYMLRVAFTSSPGVNGQYDWHYSVRPVRQF